MERSRPLGIVLIALLLVLIGVAAFITAAGMVILASMSMDSLLNMFDGDAPQWLVDNYPWVFGTIGLVFLIEGLIALLIALGFWGGRTWAWMFGLVFAVISIIIAFVQPWVIGFDDPAWATQMIWSLLWPWILIIYLNRPKIKAYFGRV